MLLIAGQISNGQSIKDSTKSFYFVSNLTLFSFDEIAYIKNGESYRSDNQSTFYPELGIELIFNKKGMSRHGLLLSYRYFTMMYNLEVNDLVLLQSVYNYQGANITYYWRQNFHNLTLSYKYYNNWNSSHSSFLGCSFNWENKNYSLDISQSDFNLLHQDTLETHNGYRDPNASNKFPNFLSFQIGHKYRVSKKFDIGLMLDYKPFSELVSSDEIVQSKDDDILAYTKVEQYKKYLLFSFVIKYRFH